MNVRHLMLAQIAWVLLVCSPAAATADLFPRDSWEHIAPGGAGWSAEKLAEARAWSQDLRVTAAMVVHHGLVVAEWGDTTAKTPLASVRKSLLSALIGNAVERHQIDLSQQIGALGIDDYEPSLTAEEKTATVRDLLQARSGIYHAALYETAAMAAQRPLRSSHRPGTFWYYNNWDFNALGAIYERAAGTSIFQSFDMEIARAIAMQDYQPSDGEYVRGAASVFPAYPINMSTRDLARFALLYLHKGWWQGRPVVPLHWVEESTKSYSQSGYGPGYGFLWWVGSINDGNAPSVKLPPGTFFAWGNGGQYAFVIPAFDLVIVLRAARFSEGGPKLREVGRLLWLLLAAGDFPDIGPDASVGTRPRLDSAALARILTGKTLIYGDRATGGPYRILLNTAGSAALLGRDSRAKLDEGSWSIREDRFCRDWKRTMPRQMCFMAVGDASHVALFDRTGLMVIDAVIADDR
jgi:CubicO group peptidase (beta-lactamase class C family)